MLQRPGAIVAGKYRIDKPLARGGGGTLWIARHTSLGHEVAVKFLDETIASSPQVRARFEREARAAANLRTPHVAQVFDYGIEKDTPYIAMELLHGETLHQRLRREGRLGIVETLSIVAQIGKGLRRAHEVGFIHRDLKPANIFLAKVPDDEVIVKILDFGIAKETGGAVSKESTKTGELIGSPHFMSPEQIRGEREIDARSDLWSLAVIAYRTLTGQLPCPGEVLTAVITKIVMDPIPPARTYLPDAPQSLDAFFEVGLARDKNQRFQAVNDLVRALAEVAAETTGIPTSQLLGPGSRPTLGSISDYSASSGTSVPPPKPTTPPAPPNPSNTPPPPNVKLPSAASNGVPTVVSAGTAAAPKAPVVPRAPAATPAPPDATAPKGPVATPAVPAPRAPIVTPAAPVIAASKAPVATPAAPVVAAPKAPVATPAAPVVAAPKAPVATPAPPVVAASKAPVATPAPPVVAASKAPIATPAAPLVAPKPPPPQAPLLAPADEPSAIEVSAILDVTSLDVARPPVAPAQPASASAEQAEELSGVDVVEATTIMPHAVRGSPAILDLPPLQESAPVATPASTAVAPEKASEPVAAQAASVSISPAAPPTTSAPVASVVISPAVAAPAPAVTPSVAPSPSSTGPASQAPAASSRVEATVVTASPGAEGSSRKTTWIVAALCVVGLVAGIAFGITRGGSATPTAPSTAPTTEATRPPSPLSAAPSTPAPPPADTASAAPTNEPAAPSSEPPPVKSSAPLDARPAPSGSSKAAPSTTTTATPPRKPKKPVDTID